MSEINDKRRGPRVPMPDIYHVSRLAFTHMEVLLHRRKTHGTI